MVPSTPLPSPLLISTIILNAISFSPLQTCFRLPSYNGFHRNPPYTTYYELEFDGNTVIPYKQGDYNPTDYGAPSTTKPSLLDFMNLHISVIPPAMDGCFGHSFDRSPPPPTAFLTKRVSFGRKHLLFHLALTLIICLPLPSTASSHLDLIPHTGTPLFFPPTNRAPLPEITVSSILNHPQKTHA